MEGQNQQQQEEMKDGRMTNDTRAQSRQTFEISEKDIIRQEEELENATKVIKVKQH